LCAAAPAAAEPTVSPATATALVVSLASAPAAPAPAEEDLGRAVKENLAALGPMSLGKPNAGALLNAVQMPPGEHWDVVIPPVAYGTAETIAQLARAIEVVNRQFPGSHRLSIGHISREHGGPLRPHRSHQSGRDVDTGYYYVPEKAEWYRPATRGTLDRARTWAFIRALVTETDVEMIFIERGVQKLIKEHALSIGEDPDWLDSIFQYRSSYPEPIVRHAWGHRTHLHIRFFSPEAQRLGARAYPYLVGANVITPQFRIRAYLVAPDDTPASIARRAGTTESVLSRANGGRELRPGQVIAVPVRGQVARVDEPWIPPRRLPPAALRVAGARREQGGVTAATAAGPSLGVDP
jgi:penicillin-insensitive murein endopeptidase